MNTAGVDDQSRDQNERPLVSFEPNPERSASPSSSARTRVLGDPSFERIERVQRRQTQVVEIDELSWWQCFKALFRPNGRKILKARVLKGLRIEAVKLPHGEVFPHVDSPFNITISVYPNDSEDPIRARCMLDTGCYQGNLISSRLAQDLGHLDYEPLDAKERNGGIVATGHTHTVVGAIHITWYHSTIPRMFRDMRFLVSESADIDLIIGTESITNHNLITPPSFFTGPGEKSDDKRDELAGNLQTLEKQVRHLKQDLDKMKADNKLRPSKEKELLRKDKDRRVAELKLARHNTVKLWETSKGKKKEEYGAQIAVIDDELNAKESKNKKAKGSKSPKL